MYTISGSMDNIASGKKFSFQIYNPEIALNESITRNCRIVDIGSLTIGNENAEFGYSKAGDWEITIRPEVSSSRYVPEDDTVFFEILDELQKPYFYANVHENGNLFWRGVIETDSIQSDIMEKTISMKIVHETQLTSKLKCNNNPFRYPVKLGKVESHQFFDKQYWIPLKQFFSDYHQYSTENTYISSSVVANSITVPVGTYSGSISNTYQEDGLYFEVNDAVATPAWTAIFNFKVDANPTELTVVGWYTGSAGDNITIDAQGSNSSWYNISTWTPKSGSWTYSVIVDPIWNVGGEVNIRFNHVSTGISGHKARFDYVALTQKVEIPTSASVHNYCPLIMKFYEPLDGTYEYADYNGIATSVSQYSASLAIPTNAFFAEQYPDTPYPATIGELADNIGQSIGCRFIPSLYNSYTIDYMTDILKDTQNIDIENIQDARLDYSNSFQGVTQNVTGVYRYMQPTVSSEDKMPKYDFTLDYGTVPRKWAEISYQGEIIEKDRVRIADIYQILCSDWMPKSGGENALGIGFGAIYNIGNAIDEVIINTNGGDFFTLDGTIWTSNWNQLYYQVAEDYLALNTNARKKLQLEVDGINYDFTKSYTISDWFGSTKFKLLEVEYDFVDNFSKLWLIEV